MVDVMPMNPDGVLTRVWPDGLPPEEEAHWAAVPEARRVVVLKRLEALVALELKELKVSDAAETAGLSRQAFHKLRSRWDADRSIRSVTPYRFKRSEAPALDERPDRGRAKSEKIPDVATAKALELIGDHPAESNGKLGRLLRTALGDTVSIPTAVKMIQRTRNVRALDPSLLAKTFGTSLLIDFIGIRIDGVAVNCEESVVAALVLERSSGLILGFEAGEKNRMAELQLKTIDRALHNLAELNIDVGREGRASCRIILPPQASGHTATDRDERLRDVVGRSMVFSQGTRRFGERTTSIIGHKVNRVRLYSRIGQHGAGRSFGVLRPSLDEPHLTVAQFATLARSEVDRRNEPLLEAVRGLPNRLALCSKGAMSETLEKVRIALSL